MIVQIVKTLEKKESFLENIYPDPLILIKELYLYN